MGYVHLLVNRPQTVSPSRSSACYFGQSAKTLAIADLHDEPSLNRRCLRSSCPPIQTEHLGNKSLIVITSAIVNNIGSGMALHYNDVFSEYRRNGADERDVPADIHRCMNLHSTSRIQPNNRRRMNCSPSPRCPLWRSHRLNCQGNYRHRSNPHRRSGISLAITRPQGNT
jgi:hypothetical protein